MTYWAIEHSRYVADNVASCCDVARTGGFDASAVESALINHQLPDDNVS